MDTAECGGNQRGLSEAHREGDVRHQVGENWTSLPTGLAHYWHDNDRIDSAWQRTGIIAPGSLGAGAILQNRRNNDLEVVVRHGRDLVHYWRNSGTWRSTSQPINTNASGPAALIQSSYGDNLQLIVQEGVRLVLYFREWNAAGQPWKFGGVVAERATGAPGFIDTGIRGTDLGASFEHNGNLYFLFGDTHWRGGFLPGTADVMAYTPDTNPWNGVGLYFHKSYACVRFPSKPPSFDQELHGEYDVPQDGFSFGGHIFAFFSTDHFKAGKFKGGKVMGRSVLARCDQAVPAIETSDPAHPLTFQYLTEFSRYRFINVSIQAVTSC